MTEHVTVAANYDGRSEKCNEVQRTRWSKEETRFFEMMITKYGKDWNEIRKSDKNGVLNRFTNKQLIKKFNNTLTRKGDKLKMTSSKNLYTAHEDKIIWNAYSSTEGDKTAFLSRVREVITTEDRSDGSILYRRNYLKKTQGISPITRELCSKKIPKILGKCEKKESLRARLFQETSGLCRSLEMQREGERLMRGVQPKRKYAESESPEIQNDKHNLKEKLKILRRHEKDLSLEIRSIQDALGSFNSPEIDGA